MNELQALRDQLVGIRGQVNAMLKTINELMRAMAEPEEEEDTRPPTFGRNK